MNAAIFAEWLRRQGRHVVRTPSSYWYDVSRRVYQAFPYFWQIAPSEAELSHLLFKEGAIALSTRHPQGRLRERSAIMWSAKDRMTSARCRAPRART